MKVAFVLAALLFAAAGPGARAGGLKSMAQGLAAGALASGVRRVAVLPFVPADGSDPEDGSVIADKVLTQFVRAGSVPAVERTLLGALMDERRLGQTGLLDRASLRRLGRLLSADGIVTGSYVGDGKKVLLQARLVRVESGVIVAAEEGETRRDWTPPPAGERCARAAERVDALERSVLELKARYWAGLLKEGLSFPSDAAQVPGIGISDPELRWDLYDRMSDYYASGRVPRLSVSEFARLETIARRADRLHRECAGARL